MNIPNSLTIVRILLVPVFIIFVINNNFWFALFIFIGAGITDGLDGTIARFLNQKTVIGAYLDPIADKFLLISAYLSLTLKGLLPDWLCVIVISRDIIILAGIAVLSLMGKKVEMKPSPVSKITTVLQILTVIVALSSIEYYPLSLTTAIVTTAIFTTLSGLQYIYRGVKIMGEEN